MRQTWILALVLGAAGPVSAQETPGGPPKAEAKAEPKTEARTPRLAVVDMAEISSKSLLGKSYATQIDALKSEIDSEGTKKNNELQKLDAQLKALQEEFEKQRGVISAEAAEKKGSEIVKKTRERQAFVEDGQAELQRMRERAQAQAQNLNGEFQQKLRPIIEAVAKEKGVDILLDSQVALTVNKAFDLTQEVIVKADDVERAARAKGASKAPATPAPKPGPAPASSPKP